MNIIVLGAGMVGAPMAIDLAKDSRFEVTIADIDKIALDKIDKKFSIKTMQSDLSISENVKSLIKDFDIVVNAVPGFMGYKTVKTIIESGKDVVDIAFFPEEPWELDKIAVDNNVTLIVDCGVAPGMSNILIGYVDHLLDKTENAVIYVGGLPALREWPYEYKAPFSPIDVIEEYTRPARYIKNGELVILPALSEPELINFPEVGTLEVFNTDGLRSLAKTIDAPDMKEKTMRYPGHIEKMRVLRETGFFSEEEIEVKGQRVRPIDLTAKLLFPKWKYEDGEVDITVMQVMVEGIKDGRKIRYTYDLLDKYDETTRTSSMARTTGYTATQAVRLIAEGKYTKKGLTVPEQLGQDQENVKFILDGLRQRGIIYKEIIEDLD